VSRGNYWLELNGEKLNQNNNRVPPDLAELVFEIQEQLAEFRAARGGDASETGDIADAIAGRRRELAAAIEQAIGDLNRNFERWDARGEHDDLAPLISELKALLSRIAYLRTLIRDVDRELDSVKAA